MYEEGRLVKKGKNGKQTSPSQQQTHLSSTANAGTAGPTGDGEVDLNWTQKVPELTDVASNTIENDHVLKNESMLKMESSVF